MQLDSLYAVDAGNPNFLFCLRRVCVRQFVCVSSCGCVCVHASTCVREALDLEHIYYYS